MVCVIYFVLGNISIFYCNLLIVFLVISCSVALVDVSFFVFDECCGVPVCREGPRGRWRRTQVVFRRVLRNFTQPLSDSLRLGRVAVWSLVSLPL